MNAVAAGEIRHRPVGLDAELQHIAHMDLVLHGLDVENRVVRRRADDLDALHARDKIEAVTVIHAAHRDKRTAADAAILVVANLAEGVHAQLADRKARLVAALDDLSLDRHDARFQKVGSEVVRLAAKPDVAKAQQVDAVGHRAVHRHVGGCRRAAADVVKLAADLALRSSSN